MPRIQIGFNIILRVFNYGFLAKHPLQLSINTIKLFSFGKDVFRSIQFFNWFKVVTVKWCCWVIFLRMCKFDVNWLSFIGFYKATFSASVVFCLYFWWLLVAIDWFMCKPRAAAIVINLVVSMSRCMYTTDSFLVERQTVVIRSVY